MIIGVAGAKGSGKSTIGAYLQAEYGFEHKAFAHKLKESVEALLDVPMWEIERLKNDPTCYVAIGHKNQPTADIVHYPDHDSDPLVPQTPPQHMWSPITEMTFRQFLQRYGDESHRKILGDDIWLDLCLPKEGFYVGRAIVLTDCRYRNEYERIKQLYGTVIKVNRPGYGSDGHASEEFDWTADEEIENDGSIEDLFAKIDDFMQWYLEVYNES